MTIYFISKQDGRLPQAYFPPSNFYKDAFQKVESVFFSDKYLSLQISKFSDFLQKILNLGGKRHF